MMRTLVGIEEEMIKEGIAIVIVIMMSLTGVTPTGRGLVVEEGIHHPIHPIHPIRMTMTSTDADAPARIATIDIETGTAVGTDLQDSPHPSLIRAP